MDILHKVFNSLMNMRFFIGHETLIRSLKCLIQYIHFLGYVQYNTLQTNIRSVLVLAMQFILQLQLQFEMK